MGETKGVAAVLQGARPAGLTHALDLTVAYEGFAAECERLCEVLCQASARNSTELAQQG